ncbi:MULTISPECIES: mandelate racemase/muconate lactonizing enzyme family protein [Reichenbachiella]|uniref:mandelate racemase/muconate lactonizing enzyme family protein n=1 Tax=Reichenbachiella TaxID=156993 RepID=UPI000E6D4F44|nr:MULTISPECIES: mandelate racemase/muconate lactonizing enzyme family protein [Reichenbachiella]MBU2912753.1 mandelate racemase/muconate lactonizing enzyme family protein [Reichenbachiella agariperforans]RJE72431.1 galactonate dehydratase [Reichenbachiella sp. MSK19-1]
MKIEKIEPFVVTNKLEVPFYFSQWKYDTRKICIVKVTLEDGTYGWGEGYGPAQVVKAGVEFFSPFIIGMKALEHEVVWQQMYLRSMDFARSGTFQAALSAIDVALWDIKGKLLQAPVSVLLGGVKNPYIAPYATGLYFEEADDLQQKLVDEAIMYKRQGFRATKMKVGLGIEQDLQYITAIREGIGSEMKLMIDSNHAYSYHEAAELARRAEQFDIAWFEEPVSPEDYEGYKRLRNATTIPIAGGECEYLRFGFKRLFEHNSVDIAQPDICAAGGLTEVKRIATLASAYNKDLVPHTWGTGIAISAATHLVANLDKNPGRMFDDLPTMELDRTENALRDELTAHQVVVNQGIIAVPEVPGLGVEVNEDKLEEFLDKESIENESIVEIRS